MDENTQNTPDEGVMPLNILSFGNILSSVGAQQSSDHTFYKNIAKDIPARIRDRLGSQLKDLYEKDLSDNKRRIDVINQGMIALGLTKSDSQSDDDSFINPAFLTSFLSLAHECSMELFTPNNIVQATVRSINSNPEVIGPTHPSVQAPPMGQQQPMAPPQQGAAQPMDMPPMGAPQQDMGQPQMGMPNLMDQMQMGGAPQPQQAPPPPPNYEPTAEEITNIYKKAAFAGNDLNQKLDEEWTDIQEEIEKAINQSFIAGSSIVHIYYDEALSRPTVVNMPTDKVVISSEAKNLMSAMRVSFEEKIPEKLMRDKIFTGEFLSIGLEAPSEDLSDFDDSPVDSTREMMTGVNPDTDYENSFEYVYTTVTSQIFISLNELQDKLENKTNDNRDHRLLPYTIKFIRDTGKVLSIKRQWDFNDPKFRKIQDLIDFKFLPGIGPFGFGLAQLAVPLARISTQLHRELVKSARMANFPGGIIRADAEIAQTNIELSEGSFIKVNTTERLADVIERSLFNPPSPMLLEILRDFENAIKNIAGITGLKMENLPSNIKSSALMAIMEKEMKPQSAVMRRVQRSFNQILKTIQRIMAKEMGEEEFGSSPTVLNGKVLKNKNVYGSQIQLRSSADPTLTSSAAQMVRNQTLIEWGQAAPDLHKMREIYYRAYSGMRIENIDMILKTEAELEAAAKAAQEAAAKTPTQTDILMQDIQQKDKSSQMKHQLEVAKLGEKSKIEHMKLMQSENAKNQEFQNELKQDETEHFKDLNDLIIKKTKVEAETGIPINLVG